MERVKKSLAVLGLAGILASTITNTQNSQKQKDTINPVAEKIIDTVHDKYTKWENKGQELNRTAVAYTSEGTSKGPYLTYNNDVDPEKIAGHLADGYNETLKNHEYLIGEASSLFCTPCYWGKPYFDHLINVFSTKYDIGGFSFEIQYQPEKDGISPEEINNFARKNRISNQNIVTGNTPQFIGFKKGSLEIKTTESTENLREFTSNLTGDRSPLPRDFLNFNENTGTLSAAYNLNNAIFILDNITKDKKVSYIPDPISKEFLGWKINSNLNNRKELVKAIQNNPTAWADFQGRIEFNKFLKIKSLTRKRVLEAYEKSSGNLVYHVPSPEKLEIFIGTEEQELRELYESGKINSLYNSRKIVDKPTTEFEQTELYKEFIKSAEALKKTNKKFYTIFHDPEINIQFPGSSNLDSLLSERGNNILIALPTPYEKNIEETYNGLKSLKDQSYKKSIAFMPSVVYDKNISYGKLSHFEKNLLEESGPVLYITDTNRFIHKGVIYLGPDKINDSILQAKK